jgi:hypothetical protein
VGITFSLVDLAYTELSVSRWQKVQQIYIANPSSFMVQITECGFTIVRISLTLGLSQTNEYATITDPRIKSKGSVEAECRLESL